MPKLLFLLLVSNYALSSPPSFREFEQPIHDHTTQHRHRIHESLESPSSYDIQSYDLNFHLKTTPYLLSGEARITVDNHIEGHVLLQAKQMNIEKILINDVVAKFSYNGEQITLLMPKGIAQVIIHYTTEKSQNIQKAGPDASNPKRSSSWYTYSQPFGAQHWFPSHDKPHDKALLNLTMTVPENLTVVSNGTLQSVKKQDSQRTFHFKHAHPIAPYLVSINVGEFDYEWIGEFQKKPLTIWAQAEAMPLMRHETKRTGLMLDIFSRFTGVDYPFHLYTQTLAQSYGTSMEHQSATTMGGYRISGDGLGEGVVAHELAHQWFGDFVTCQDWGELWLNEGFASYLPYIFFQEGGDPNRALGYQDYWRQGYFAEAKSRVRPLSQTSVDYDHLFDAHAYQKGALVLHYLRSKVGPESFTNGLREYLTSHAYSHVTQSDLRSALEKASQEDLRQDFDQWVLSPGHPILKASWKQNGDFLTLDITQAQIAKGWKSFQFDLEIEVFTKDSSSLLKKTIQPLEQQQISIPMQQVVAVQLNPHWTLPAEISIEQSISSWLTVLQDSLVTTSRLQSLRELLKHPLQEATIQALLKRPNEYLNMEALDTLANVDSATSSVDKIIHFYKTRNVKSAYLRASIIQAKTTLAQRSQVATKPLLNVQESKEKFFTVTSTVERRAILKRMALQSEMEAIQFAKDRLEESTWSTRDRGYLLDIALNDKSDSTWTKELLKSASSYWLKQATRKLQGLSIFHNSYVLVLKERMLHERMDKNKRAIRTYLELASSKNLTSAPPVKP